MNTSNKLILRIDSEIMGRKTKYISFRLCTITFVTFKHLRMIEFYATIISSTIFLLNIFCYYKHIVLNFYLYYLLNCMSICMF
jgi:hypothetical protein